MSAYTAGPWKMKYDQYAGYDCMSPGFKITAGEQDIVTVDCADYMREWNTSERQYHPIESEANARLIASSPVMLNALEKAFEWSCRRSETKRKWTASDQYIHEVLKSAIETAKGD
jgi:hypothetical protein